MSVAVLLGVLPRPLHLGIYWYDIGPPGLKILDTWCIRLCPLALSHNVCAASLCDCYSRSRSRCADKSVRGLVRNSKMCSKIRGWVAVLYVNDIANNGADILCSGSAHRRAMWAHELSAMPLQQHYPAEPSRRLRFLQLQHTGPRRYACSGISQAPALVRAFELNLDSHCFYLPGNSVQRFPSAITKRRGDPDLHHCISHCIPNRDLAVPLPACDIDLYLVGWLVCLDCCCKVYRGVTIQTATNTLCKAPYDTWYNHLNF
jgi:hypothetical protein